jgi:hypothetical protein
VVFLSDQEEILTEKVHNNPALEDLSKSSHKDIILFQDDLVSSNLTKDNK